MDAEMLLKLMSVMKGAQGAGAQNNVGADSNGNSGFPSGAFGAAGGANAGIMSLLPLLFSGVGANAQSAAQNGADAQNNMLPLLLSLLGGGNPFRNLFGSGNGATQQSASGGAENGRDAFGQNAGDNGCARDNRRDGGYDRGGNFRHYGHDGARYADAAYARNAYATRAPYSPPFDDIGFAGAEVRGFMEQLWRLRRKI